MLPVIIKIYSSPLQFLLSILLILTILLFGLGIYSNKKDLDYVKSVGGIDSVFEAWECFAKESNMILDKQKHLTIRITYLLKGTIFTCWFALNIRYANNKAFLNGNLSGQFGTLIKSKEYKCPINFNKSIVSKLFYTILNDTLKIKNKKGDIFMDWMSMSTRQLINSCALSTDDLSSLGIERSI